MKKLFFLSAAIIFSLNVFSQAPAIQWQKCLGGTSNDRAESIRQTSDGGYVIAGYSVSNNGDVTGNHGSNDFWIVKLDGTGNIQWQKSLGGSGADQANCVQQTNDGGYIVAGATTSNDGDVNGIHSMDTADCWIVKLNSSGNLQWQKCLGGTKVDGASSVAQTIDGGYIVAGSTRSNDGDVAGLHSVDTTDCWLVRLDAVGNILWQKCLGGNNGDGGNSIQQTQDGGYVIGGVTGSNDGDVSGNHGNADFWVVKLDFAGSIQWQECFGSSSSEGANSLQVTSDKGYIIAGESMDNGGDVTGHHGPNWAPDFWIVKLDSNGTLIWQRSLGGTATDIGYSIGQTTDGGAIVAGYTHSNDGDVSGFHGSGDFWVAKLDTGGNVQWQNAYGGSAWEEAYSVQQTNDGGCIVAGYAQSINGDVVAIHGSYDYWIVKLGPDVTGIQQEETNSSFSISLSPNPTSKELLLSISSTIKPNTSASIYNFLGVEVLAVPVTNSQTSINISALGTGVYFVNVKEGGRSAGVKKLVKM